MGGWSFDTFATLLGYTVIVASTLVASLAVITWVIDRVVVYFGWFDTLIRAIVLINRKRQQKKNGEPNQ